MDMKSKTILRKKLKYLRILYWKLMIFESWRCFKKERRNICNKTIEWCESNEENKEKFKNELIYLKKYGATHFPYKWASLKFVWKIKMDFDCDDDPYVIHAGHRLYIYPYPYSQLLLEQNSKSAHCYFGAGKGIGWPTEGSVFIDVGAAEGIMSLTCMIERNVDKVYLIEGDTRWKNKLEKTFKDFRDINVIYKYAADFDDENHISLDTLLKDIEQEIFIKIDVEGMEQQVLDGARKILERKNVNCVIATYHKPNDDKFLEKYLKDLGFETEFSKGYIALMQDTMLPPYLRKGIIRAWKT